MLTLKHFSFFAPGLDLLNFDTFPALMSFDGHQFQINQENSKFYIRSNRQYIQNGAIHTDSAIAPGDLVNFDHEFLLFHGPEKAPAGNFIAKIKIKGEEDKLLLFKLSRKNSGEDYQGIIKTMALFPEAGKIIIDVSATQFMDSDAIQGMIALLQKVRDEKQALTFYKPSPKFITYLKLANIEKRVPLNSTPQPHIDQILEQQAADQERRLSGVRFSIASAGQSVALPPETVLSVGRLNTNCGLPLSDTQISRIHAVFIHTGARLFVIDCRSTNCSFVNGEKIAPFCLVGLQNHDTVAFGRNSHFMIQQTGS